VALIVLRQQLAVHGMVQQADLAGLFGNVSKQTVSRWCDEWEASGVIVRSVSGRTKTVALSESCFTGGPLKLGGLRGWGISR
jgi:predicted transcriptional regulator